MVKEGSMFRVRLVGALILAGLLVTLLGFTGLRFYKSSQAQQSGYSANLRELRDRFNADKGKVRLLLLLSPT
jgi:hypothetical protein